MICKASFNLIRFCALERSSMGDLTREECLDVFLCGEIYEYETKGADLLVYKTFLVAKEILDECQSAKDTIERLENSFATHGVDWTMLRQELTFDQITRIADSYIDTAEETNRTLGTKIPAVPFGHKNSTWEWMLREYLDGDKFYDYGTVSNKKYKTHGVQSGYCMVRGNKIMITLCTART
jgi:hypothetical protein